MLLVGSFFCIKRSCLKRESLPVEYLMCRLLLSRDKNEGCPVVIFDDLWDTLFSHADVYFTVTRMVTVLPAYVALIEVLPLLTAVIWPFFTVATLDLELVHTAAEVTSDGLMVV
ncbi:hypothetical protein D3C78_702170 [compost metagenome]